MANESGVQSRFVGDVRKKAGGIIDVYFEIEMARLIFRRRYASGTAGDIELDADLSRREPNSSQ